MEEEKRETRAERSERMEREAAEKLDRIRRDRARDANPAWKEFSRAMRPLDRMAELVPEDQQDLRELILEHKRSLAVLADRLGEALAKTKEPKEGT